jgi:hypothetical protein
MAAMDESHRASVTSVGCKFPCGEPDDDWTIEELIRWSLDRHHTSAIERTIEAVSSLRDRCERECDDVMTLHAMAVGIEEGGGGVGGEGRTRNGVAGGGRGGGDVAKRGKIGSATVDGENVDPQRMSLDGVAISGSKTNAADEDDDDDDDDDAIEISNVVANNDPVDPASSSILPLPSSHSPQPNANNSTMAVQITSGPHAPSRFHLRPRPGAPCLVGRSKGKKFVKNGISLHRDQEVSTTHGKFVVVEEDGGGGGGGGLLRKRYYFVDVGSTNGTVHDGVPLVPNVRLSLVDGMELKIGNSILRIVLS